MSEYQLFEYQLDILRRTEHYDRVAYYLEMGTGKTFIGSEKAVSFHDDNILIICQKSKVTDWVEHMSNYGTCYDLTKKKQLEEFNSHGGIGVINYDSVWRRTLTIQDTLTLMLDESQNIQNEKAKRTKYISNIKFDHLILLSGTPTGGQYEKLYSQLKLLGWNISKGRYWSDFIKYRLMEFNGFQTKIVTGYKNVEKLKDIMSALGCVFLKSDEVLTLPDQRMIRVKCKPHAKYQKFKKCSVVDIGRTELVGDTVLTQLLHERELCGMYSMDKLNRYKDLVESTDDRLIVFYNFNKELELIMNIDRPLSFVNGSVKDLEAYENCNNSVTLIQYQSGATGLNLQKANKVIYFSPPLSSSLFEQSKKRIHRIGQNSKCLYYCLYCPGTVEEHIYEVLDKRKDYTEALFRRC